MEANVLRLIPDLASPMYQTSHWQDTLWKFLPLLASLVVVFVGSWLTGRAKRREWIADNQKEEYRKVLTGLNRLNMLLVSHNVTGMVDAQQLGRAMEETSIAFNTSLFINDFLEETGVAGEILFAAKQLENGGSFDEYHKKYWKAINLIISSAKKIRI